MSTRLPSKQKALFLNGQQGEFVIGENQVPRPSSRQLLLKIKAIALNPVDWKIRKHGFFVNEYPAILGTDLSGEVVAVGEGVTKFSVGDRVFCQGRFTTDYGSFQEYTLADEFHLAKIPSNITYDQAATIPLGLTTAFCAMYNSEPHGIALANPAIDPSNQGRYKGEPFVILGGASSVGQFAIQLAKLSGFSPIITTASLKHTDFLTSLGATHVVDRHPSARPGEGKVPVTENIIEEKIREITNKPINYIYDAISLSETQHTAARILSHEGYLMLVMSPQVTLKDKQHVLAVLAIRQLNQNIKLLEGMYEKLEEWVANGVIRPNQVETLSGGLTGIVGGLQRMEDNLVSGVKLVVRPEETPAGAL